MSEHKFKAFLQSRNWNENQSKRFVDHAVNDPELPDTEEWVDLEDYLKAKRASADTIEEVKYVWNLYVDSTLGQVG